MLVARRRILSTIVFATPVVVALIQLPRAHAQQAAPGSAESGSTGRRIATARRTAHPPIIDGAPDDAVWAEATPLGDFIQSDPFEGQPATERTEVRILYDDKNIYVGVTCFDSEPSLIVTSDTRRDADMSAMDSFQLIFDTFHDRQNGFVFGTNAAGSQYDAQIRNEGETQQVSAGPGLASVGAGGGGTGGNNAGAGVNVNWDADWDVKSRVSDVGWTAEFRIPFRTLRYGAPPQVWGLNLTRQIRRKREQDYWSPVSRAHSLFRLSSAGDLVGLNVDPPRNFKLLPYAISNTNRAYGSARKITNDVNNDWGIDAKYGVTPSLNLDLTYNTDFAQVEADQQQINLTRFNLVFPEKRPFFLENAGLFAFGKSGEAELMYSRRIGISDDGELVPIRGGARVSGKAGDINVGVMNMQTEAVGRTPANNFTAVRANKELPKRSRIGAIFTNRSATGDRIGGADWNRAWGVDGKLGMGEALTFNGWAARTETPGFTGSQHAYSGAVEYNTKDNRDYLQYDVIGQQFNPEVGFLQKTGGYQVLSAGWFEHWRNKRIRALGFRELLPHQSYQRFTRATDGTLLTATIHNDMHLDWENGNYISPAVNIDWDRLDRPFEIYPGVVVPPGSYRAPHTAFQMNTDKKKPFWANLGHQWGGFLSGHQNSMAPSVSFRQGANLVTSLTWVRNDIHLPQGAFKTNLGTIRVAYNFSPLLSVQSLVQYNDRTSRWSTNLRFGWLDTAGTGLFVVYNDTEGMNGLGPINRSLILKYSRQFDVLQ